MSEVQPAEPRRPSPFSIRLNESERAKLENEAQGVPLGTYIKAKALGGRALRGSASLGDRRAFAQALGLIGQTRFASNLNQLAHLGHIGALAFTPEVQEELRDALKHIAEIRALLLRATGSRKEA